MRGLWARGRALLGVALVALSLGAVAAPSRPFSPPADLKPGEIRELRFVVWDGDEGQRVLRPVVREFEKLHPWIRVKFEGAPYSNYHQKLLAQYAAGVAPDVVMMDPANFQRMAKRGAMLELNQFYNSPGFPKNADGTEIGIDDYYKEIVDAHSYKGKLYVLPRDIAPVANIYYNKRLFDEAGIPYPDGTWTWDFKVRPELKEKDFLWVVQQLSKKNAQGRPTQWGYVPAWPQVWVETMAFSTGAKYADDPESPRKILTNSPEWLRAWEAFADQTLVKKWIPSTTEISSVMQTNTDNLFLSGKVAMYQNGIWVVPRFREALIPGSKEFFEWDIALAPAYKDGTKAYPTGGSGYSVVSSTPYPEDAWRLAAWMAGPPGMVGMAAAGQAQPAIKQIALSDAWLPTKDSPKIMQYPWNRIITHEAVPYVKFAPTSDLWPEVGTLASSRVESVLTGLAKPKDALSIGAERAQDRLDVLLKEQDLPPFKWELGLVLAVVLLAVLVAWIYYPERGRLKTMSSRQRKENRAGYWFVMPWILGMLIFTIGPMVLSLLMSVADWDIIRAARWRGVENYREAFFVDPRFWISLRVTFVYSIFAVPLGLVGSLLLALLLNVKVRGIALYRACFYMPALASAVAGALIWRKIFQPEGGLLNWLIYGADGNGNFLGLATFLSQFNPAGQQTNWLGNEQTALPAMIIMSLWGIGGGMVILLAGLQGIPQFYYEAATVDGANLWTKFRNVTFPLLTPSLFFSLITGVIGSFQVFTQAFVLTSGGPNDSTRFYMLHLYENAFLSLRMGYASALAWILFVVILIFTLAQLKLNKYVYYEGGAR